MSLPESTAAAASVASASWPFDVSFLPPRASFPLSPLAYRVLNYGEIVLKDIVNIPEVTTLESKIGISTELSCGLANEFAYVTET